MIQTLEVWKEFNVAMAGATGALAGLAIVAASVNITEIVKSPSLTARLAAGISTLVLALIVSALGLIPHLSLAVYGFVVLLAAALASTFQIVAAQRVFQNKNPANRLRPIKAGLGFLPLLSYLAAGIFLLLMSATGLACLAAGSILAIISALMVSWVVLVEVRR